MSEFLNLGVIFNKNQFAIYDLDWCIIKTKSGKIFPKDYNDWEFLYDCIPNKLREISKTKIVMILTNQLGISEGKVDKKKFIEKIKQIQQVLNIPILVGIACNNDNFRKPRTGFIDHIKKISIYGENAFYKEGSFFVGDMAGRLKSENHKKDRYDTDRKFALNLGIKFYTPEMYFLEKEPRPFEKTGYQLDYETDTDEVDLDQFNENKMMVLVCGYPGSGKTTFSKKLDNFLLISKDLYKSRVNKILEDNLKLEQNIIVEGLMYNNEKRNKYLKLAKKYDYQVIYVDITTSFDLSYHLNIYRSLNDGVKIIPKVVYYTYRKYFEEPKIEDYKNIIKYHPRISQSINDKYLY